MDLFSLHLFPTMNELELFLDNLPLLLSIFIQTENIIVD